MPRLLQAMKDVMLGNVMAGEIDRSENHLQYALLGDPALSLNLPMMKVVVDSINGISCQRTDTVPLLRAGDIARIAGHVDIHPFADSGRTVESLGKLPWLTRLSQLLLHLAGGKVDAHGHRIIIAVGETLRNGLAQLADAHHQLGLILYSSQMIRNEERLAVVEQRRISLGKNNRTLWFR